VGEVAAGNIGRGAEIDIKSALAVRRRIDTERDGFCIAAFTVRGLGL
jgi:hypothetical protein